MEHQKTINLISNVIRVLLLLALMMIYSSSCTASNLGNKTDQLALLEFKSMIAEDPYEILSSWNESQHHCQWRGVACERRRQRVIGLDLHGQNLFGPISPHIGNLSFLKYINLDTNRLNGEVPQEIGRLIRLRHIKLTNNTLGGSIPYNISYLKELYTLDLAGNKLTGEIPVGIGSLKKLGLLGLQENNLRGEIPQSFGNLSALEKISVAFNNLQGSIPNELSELKRLTFFSIAVNNLSGIIPTSLYNISSLRTFSVTNNLLTGSLPSDCGSTLPNLNVLNMGGNQFTGEIPTSFAKASRIEEFDISANSFTGHVPNNIGMLSGLQLFNVETNKLGANSTQDFNFLVPLSNCTNLNILSFAYNNLGGQLPISVANLSVQLKVLAMGGNQIYGSIPEALTSLTSLYVLAMENNLLTGIIPSLFGTLKQLQELYLHRNQLSGQIPSSLGNISQLGLLSIAGNKFSGEVPESISNCQKLQFLDISANNLFGVIPPQVLAIPSLSRTLNLSQNSLSGTIPAEVGKLISLNELDISGNNFSGEIPPSIGDCLSLEYVNMHGNSFQGIIPSNLASLKGMRYLDLSRNNLSGQIPKVLESLAYLQYLNLSFNDLEGEIPRTGVFGNASAISLTGNSKLCGGIPELDKPSCPNTQVKKKHKISYAYKLIGAIVSVVVFLVALTSYCVLYWRRKTQEASYVASFDKDKLMKISYRELHKATNGFSLENLIGSGSFGSVYSGKLDQQTDQLIAVKVLNLENSRASKSFLAECKVLRNVRHRNLVKILTYCSSIDSCRSEFKALVYEFMPNGNLDMWLHPDEANSSRTLSLLQRVNIAIDVASGLQYLHSHCETPIVHCDLKPSNILLNDDMCALVGDFGLARFHPKATSEILEMSSIGLKGSIGYAAPEYGIGSEVSACGDIYSYGIILLEMMTGRRPTDDNFEDGLNLHNYVKKAIPKPVNKIIDPLIFREERVETIEEEEFGENNDEIVEMDEHGRNVGSSSREANLKMCIMSILTIALACSQESPTQRMDMNDVNNELYHVKSALLGHGRNSL